MKDEMAKDIEVAKLFEDEKQKDYAMVIRNYPRMSELKKANMKEKKAIVCRDLKDLDVADEQVIDPDQISKVFPTFIHPNYRQMGMSSKGTLKIIFRNKVVPEKIQ